MRAASIILLGLLTGASLPALGCQAQQQLAPEPGKKASKKEGAKASLKTGKADKGEKAHEHAEEHGQEPGRFIVPFAWEAAQDEPLSHTRAFLRDAFADNDVYMEHGPKFFAAFADKQTPRATVVTCADSRVHSQAWDVTPENDDFTIRNIGNQVSNAAGSVEYGVEHLRTPLLLVIGHTGCGAVKAAMGDISKLSPPIRAELEPMSIPKPASGKSPEAAWAEGVVANVNNQVAFSLKHFGKQVQAGQLTVVGAVFDFRNDLLQGAGKLVIVNVNGNTEAARMTAFVEAIENSQQSKQPKDPKEASKRHAKLDDELAAEEIAARLAKLRGDKPLLEKVGPASHGPAAPAEADEHHH
jgi:carbonic anhydrase